jgi:hypothetical protein
MKNLTAIENLSSEFYLRDNRSSRWFSVECIDQLGDLVCRPQNETEDLTEASEIVEKCKACGFVEIRLVQWKRTEDLKGIHLDNEQLIAKYCLVDDTWETVVSFPIQASAVSTVSIQDARRIARETLLSKRSGEHYRQYVAQSDDEICEQIMERTDSLEHIEVIGYLCDLANGQRSKIVLQWAKPHKNDYNVELITREYDPIGTAIYRKHAEHLDSAGESIKQEAVSIFAEAYLRSLSDRPQIVKTVEKYIDKDQPWLGKQTIERKTNQPTNDKVCQILATMAVYEALSDSRKLDRTLELDSAPKTGKEFEKYVTDHTYRETMAEMRKNLTTKQFRTLLAIESGLTQRQAGEATGQNTSTINEHLKTIRTVARKIVQG